MTNLAGLHLLVTRPPEQAAWLTQLEALGAETIHHPMLTIQPLTDRASKQRITSEILRLDEYHKAIFISQNAVRFGTEWIDNYWPQLPQELRFFAIGSKTANYLQTQLGLIDQSIQAPLDAMNSESLLALPAMEQVANERILIFRGQGGRTYLKEALDRAGATVRYCELYQRRSPDTIDIAQLTHFIQSSKQRITVVHSGETLDNLCTLLDHDTLQCIKQQPVLVPGPRVTESAQQYGFKTIITADNATHSGMINTLYQWWKKRL